MNTRIAGLLVVALSACHPTPKERATVRRWLLCEECTEGERESVVALGYRVVAPLGDALQGPPGSGRENTRLQAEAMFARLASPPLTQPQYVNHYVDNYVATYQFRAAVALGQIGTARARALLLDALRNDSIPYREDVRRAIRAAAQLELAPVDSTTQFAPAGLFVRTDPTVVVRDTSDTAGPRPLANIRVVFQVVAGDGKVTDSIQTTSATGIATVRWRLGPGIDSVNILRVTAIGQTVYFTAVGRGPDPRAIFVIQPRNTSGGQPMDTIRVAVVDPWGDAVASFAGYGVLTLPQTGDSLVRPVVAGVADFTGLVLHSTGSGLRLDARMVSTSNPNTPLTLTATSDPFDLGP